MFLIMHYDFNCKIVCAVKFQDHLGMKKHQRTYLENVCFRME